MIQHRDPPVPWVEALARIAPRSERFSWLLLYWWAGEPWQEVQRWSVWEMLPPAWLCRTPRYAQQFAPVREALEGPPPRSFRRFGPTGQFLYSEAEVTQEQWDLWRVWGCLARPFWIIQGDRGGHKWTFSPPEQMLLKLHGLPAEPPRPGDLPYAEWSDATAWALRVQRELHDQSLTIVSPGADADAAHRVARVRSEQDFRRALLDWLKPQVRGALAESDSEIKGLDLPTGPEVTDDQLAASEELFIRSTAHTEE